MPDTCLTGIWLRSVLVGHCRCVSVVKGSLARMLAPKIVTAMLKRGSNSAGSVVQQAENGADG